MKVRKNEGRTDAIRRFAVALFGKATPLPKARRAIATALGEAPDGSTVIAIADAAYYREAGLRCPLPASANRGPAALAEAIAKRRDGSDRTKVPADYPAGIGLRRWDTLAASATVTTGTKVSVADVKALYGKAGRDTEASYAGRGTRAGAPKTYAAAALRPAEVAVAKPPKAAKPKAAKPKAGTKAAKPKAASGPRKAA